MPISGMIIQNGSTAQAAPTGGFPMTLTEDGVKVPNGKHVADASTNFLTRSNATFRNRPPVLQSDGSWSKCKRSMLFVVPMILADGSTCFNLVRIELEYHPETSNSEIDSLRYNGSQLLTDSDLDDFIMSGSLA